MSGCAFDARGATTTCAAHEGWGARRDSNDTADDAADSPGAPSAPLLGTAAASAKATPARVALNRRYALAGAVLLLIAVLGFASAIGARLSTGVWYRDPLPAVRTKPIPTERLGPLVALHALTGSAWLVLVALQVSSIAIAGAGSLPSIDPASRPASANATDPPALRLHRALGKRSFLFANSFALSALVLVVAGAWRGGKDAEGGYNTWFVRWVEFGAVALSWVFYLNGMTYVSLKDSLYEKYPHLELTPALCVSRHKDCMLASLFFAAVPTGLPRLLRDVLQSRESPGGCNYADSSVLFFAFACVACVLGLPLMLLCIGGRFHVRLYVAPLAWYGTVVAGSFALLRPDLTLYC